MTLYFLLPKGHSWWLGQKVGTVAIRGEAPSWKLPPLKHERNQWLSSPEICGVSGVCMCTHIACCQYAHSTPSTGDSVSPCQVGRTFC